MPSRLHLVHLHPPGIDVPLLVVLTVAGVATALLLGLALAAFTRRRSRPYLLVGLAIAALFARTVVAGLTMIDVLPAEQHHIFEHSLDVAMAALVIGAVYYARTVDERFERGEEL